MPADGARQEEVAAERIEELVEEAPVAGDDPGVAVHVAPEGALVDAVDLDVAAARVAHGDIADDEVERIGRDQEVTGEDRVVELVGEVVGLGRDRWSRKRSSGVRRRSRRRGRVGGIDHGVRRARERRVVPARVLKT